MNIEAFLITTHKDCQNIQIRLQMTKIKQYVYLPLLQQYIEYPGKQMHLNRLATKCLIKRITPFFSRSWHNRYFIYTHYLWNKRQLNYSCFALVWEVAQTGSFWVSRSSQKWNISSFFWESGWSRGVLSLHNSDHRSVKLRRRSGASLWPSLSLCKNQWCLMENSQRLDLNGWISSMLA